MDPNKYTWDWIYNEWGGGWNKIPVEPQGISRNNFRLRRVQSIAIINSFFGDNGRLLIEIPRRSIEEA